MNRQLAIAALGNDRPGLVKALSQAITEQGCNIEDSRMAILGGKFALILLVGGPTEAIAALCKRCDSLGPELGLQLTAEETRPTPRDEDVIPCRINAVAIDHPGIVYRLSQFFAERGINIRELDTERYAAAHTGSPLFSVTMRIDVPADQALAALREQLSNFTNDLNIDCTLEAIPPH